MTLSQASYEGLAALGLGFAFSGLLASAAELLLGNPVSFRMLQLGGARALASIPLLLFSAPFVILRNTVRGSRLEGRSFGYVFTATVLAGFWSLLCGRLVFDAARIVSGA